MSDETKPFLIRIPLDLHRRAHSLAKRHSTTATQIARDGLTARVEFLENKEREEKERKARDLDEKRKARGIRNIGESPMAPRQRDLAPQPNLSNAVDDDEIAAPSSDPVVDLYEQHARLIFEAIEQPTECRIRTDEAVRSIKNYSLLTHPGDSVILEKLERIVVRLRAARVAVPAPVLSKTSVDDVAARVIDGLVNRIINPATVRSFGDTNAPSDDDE